MGLIDDIAVKAGCEYVSELKYHPERYPVLEILSAIPLESYDEKQWQEAVSYLITDSDVSCGSAACKIQLLEYLHSKNAAS